MYQMQLLQKGTNVWHDRGMEKIRPDRGMEKIRPSISSWFSYL